MTFSAEPASASTSWYGWATDVHNALTSPTSAAAQSSLASTYLMRLSNRSVPGPGALPKLMTSPPTISAANLTGTSTITSAVNVPAIDGSNNPNSAQITFRGGPWQQRGPSPDNMYAWGTPLTGGESTSFPYVEFLYYGTALEFGYRGQGTLSTRVWVDGLLAENAYTTDTTQDGALHLRKITFSAAGWRRIRIDLSPAFWGLNIGPNDVVQPAPSTGDKLLIIGDSFGEGTGAQDPFSGYAPAIGAMLGFNELISLSQGGTGVLAINAGLGRPKYRDRSADWAQVNATHVIVQMSVNDDSFTTSALATELALLLPAVRALSTVKTVWVMGRPAVRDTDVTWAVSRDAAIKPAADALGVPWISLTSPSSIWTGSGHVGATTGTGSCDVLVSSDGTHPTQAGHDGIARMFVNRLLAQLPA
jgi:lysophospholipase L1-like esterase